MLFLSAFWCRYCQRMDEEAFSDTEVIALLNAYFIPLRVDYAQRPDVDARYNLNGWPTLAFMAPSGQLLAAANFLPAGEFKEFLIDVYMSYQQLGAAEGMTEKPPRPLSPLADREMAASLAKITESIMTLADQTHGGYDRGQKFIHPQANQFLLERYETTKDPRYLSQVCLTLERMRSGELYDPAGGAYFRTSSNPDWSHPHREKLLSEEAGLLANCLSVFRLSRRAEYRRMAEEIIEYLDRKLLDPASGAFFGCEDFLRRESGASGGDFFTIIDRCIYVDANAVVAAAYLDAAVLLDESSYRDRAFAVMNFLWQHCRGDTGGMCHFFDGKPQVRGLLQDQAQMGIALVYAYNATGAERYLNDAKQLAEFILVELKNPAGGFYDVLAQETVALGGRLTLIELNGAAATFFCRLSSAARDAKYRDGARHALGGFAGDFESYGIHAAPLGIALQTFLSASDPTV
jgi:uncharacterized protein